MGGEELLNAATERIVDLENTIAVNENATKVLYDIEEMLDLNRTPDPYPGKVGVLYQIEALIDAWTDALMALNDLLTNSDSQAARDHANAVLVASRFGIKKY